MQTVTTTESREPESAAGSLTLDHRTTNFSASQSANGGARPKRNQSLDVLRCVAILLVLGRHLDYYPLWSKIGWIGVDLFFVLSGFLVPGLMFHEFKEHGRINFRRLVLRRGLKIWPAFYTYILITAALVEFIQYRRAGAFPWRQFITTSLFLPNYFPNDSRFFAHIWSLAVEEHFYLILPFVLFVLLVSRNHRLLPRSARLSERLRSRSAPIIGQCTQGSTACSQESQLVTAAISSHDGFRK